MPIQPRRRTAAALTYFSYFSSSTTDTANEIYERAVLAFDVAKAFQQELEEKRNREQYEAWQKANDSSKKKNTIRGGVAVVKTIVKQMKRNTGEEREKELLLAAQSLLEEAGLQHGHSTALVRLGNAALEEGNDGTTKAMDYYRRANSPEGWFNLGHLLWNMEFDDTCCDDAVTYRKSKEGSSTEAFQKAIDLGDADAMYFVGVQQLSKEDEGDDLKQVHQNGLNLITSAADQGHGGALHYLALFYLQGSPVLGIDPPNDSADFLQRLDAAADAGDAEALFLRGHGYYHGQDGREKDAVKALENFLQAAEGAGHADAAISAGAMLHQGVPGNRMVQKNQQRAFELYQLAGELGSKEGWRNVVACYMLGEGVTKSKKTAEYIAKTMLLKEDDDVKNDR